MENIYRKIIEIEEKNLNAALCITTTSIGSSPRKTGTKMIVYESGEIFGTIGGGKLESVVIQKAIEAIGKQTSENISFNLLKDLDMQCGGRVEIYIEPIIGKYRLYIFGDGHIGKSLAFMANHAGFDVTVIDQREGIFDTWSNVQIATLNIHFQEAFKTLTFKNNTFVCSATHEHKLDFEITALSQQQQPAYIGMVGSVRKFKKAQELWLNNNMLTETDIAKIDCPAGVEIKAETPEEIAVSILAKMIEVRND